MNRNRGDDFELDLTTDLSYKLIRQEPANDGTGYNRLHYLVNDLGNHEKEKGVYSVEYLRGDAICKECASPICRHARKIEGMMAQVHRTF